MPKMVEVVIDSVRVSLTNQQRIVVLREVNTERYLPILIGPYEAEAITIALQEIEVARPQTHDLLKNILQALNARLMRVEVLALREDVFYGNLVVSIDDNLLNIDARPSDALALAARTHVPIMVMQEVLETAGIEPEKDLQEPKSSPRELEDMPEVENEDIEAKKRLSVFEDFLENLDMDNLSEPSEDDDQPDESDDPSPEL